MTIEIQDGRPSFRGSVRNGVASQSWGAWGRTFVFVGGDGKAMVGSGAGKETAGQSDPCERDMSKISLCYLLAEKKGASSAVRTFCADALGNPMHTPLGKLEACLVHLPATIWHNGEIERAGKAMELTCGFPTFGESGPTKAPEKVRRAGKAACFASLPQPRATAATQDLDAVATAFAEACGVEVAEVKARAYQVCDVQKEEKKGGDE